MSWTGEDSDIIAAIGVVFGVLVLIAAYYFYRRRCGLSPQSAALLDNVGVNNYDGLSPPTNQAATSFPYRVKKRLGDGAYGSVHLALRKADHQLVALKVIPCKDEREASESMKEYHMCQEVQGHEGIVRVHDVFFDTPVDARKQATDDGSCAVVVVASETNTRLLKELQIRCPVGEKYLCIVSEYCEEGTLFDLLVTRRGSYVRQQRGKKALPTLGLDEPVVWSYTLQLLEAIAFLHSKSLMHRDLKPSNVLLADNHRRVLLTDFGLSRFVEAEEYAQTRTGTLQYMSPEQVQRRYNNKGDVWGVGCLLHAMCTAKVTTAEARIMFRDRAKPNFDQSVREEELVGYSDALVKFMLQLLSFRYQERPSAAEAVEMCKQCMAEGNFPHRTK